MRRRPWFWVGVVFATLFGVGILALMTIGLWRFASYGPRVGGFYGRGGFHALHGNPMWPGMVGFGFIEPLGMLILLGLAAFGLYALFSGGYRARWDARPTCPNCHRPARHDWRVCPYCGHPLNQPTPAPTPVTSNPTAVPVPPNQPS